MEAALGDLFLENELRDYIQALSNIPQKDEPDRTLLKRGTKLFARFIGLPGIERAILFNKIEPILWDPRKEIVSLRLELLRQASAGTPVSEVFHDLLRRPPAEPDPTIRGPYLNAVTGAALGRLAEMAHQANLRAAQ